MLKQKIQNRIPSIGMRSVKTVIATLLAIIASNVLKFESPFYATLSAFMCIQSTVIETSNMAMKRGIGTLIGGIFSLFYLVFMPQIIYLIPLGILGIIYLYNLLDKNNLISVSCVVFLIISFNVNTGESFDPLNYVINRVWQTFTGILIAIIINNFIYPQNPFDNLKPLNNQMSEFINNVLADKVIINADSLKEFKSKIDELSDLIRVFYKEKFVPHKYDLNIEYYNKQLDLFETAYNHFSILSAMPEDTDKSVLQYHAEKIRSIRDELLKHSF